MNSEEHDNNSTDKTTTDSILPAESTGSSNTEDTSSKVNLKHLSLADSDDLIMLQIYLLDALEDLASLDTLMSALGLTEEDIEDMIIDELEN